MEIVHATWEKRNLGVDSYKMRVGDSDTWEDVVREEKDVFGDYLVMKVPENRRDISFRLNELGYSFVEAQIYCHYDNYREFYLNPVQRRLFEAVSYEKLNQYDMDEVYSNVAKGLFVDDTVATDPNFSVEHANKRFIGLISDNLSRGAMVYGLKFHNETVGFFGLEAPSKDEQFGFIGAIYPKYQRIGFGSLMLCFEIDQAIKNGVSKTGSTFSSNNHGAFTIHMSMGFILDRVEYIFVKHNKKAV